MDVAVVLTDERTVTELELRAVVRPGAFVHLIVENLVQEVQRARLPHRRRLERRALLCPYVALVEQPMQVHWADAITGGRARHLRVESALRLVTRWRRASMEVAARAEERVTVHVVRWGWRDLRVHRALVRVTWARVKHRGQFANLRKLARSTWRRVGRMHT